MSQGDQFLLEEFRWLWNGYAATIQGLKDLDKASP